MKIVALQLLLLVLVAAGIVSVWLRPPIIEVRERVTVEAAPRPVELEVDPDEPIRVCRQIAEAIKQSRKGVTIKQRLYFMQPATPREIKLKFADDWRVWFDVPPLKESRAGEWTLVLVPR